MPAEVEPLATQLALAPTFTTFASGAEPSAAMTWLMPAAEPLALLNRTSSFLLVPPVSASLPTPKKPIEPCGKFSGSLKLVVFLVRLLTM